MHDGRETGASQAVCTAHGVTAYNFVIGRTCGGQVTLLGSPLVFSPDFSVGGVGWFFFSFNAPLF